MATIKFLLVFFCLTVASRNGLLNRYLLNNTPDLNSVKGTESGLQQLENQLRSKLVNIAYKEVGIREKSGNNDGIRIKEYLAHVGLSIGEPYCAAFVSWVFGQVGFTKPRSGWSPDLFPGSRLARSALPGNVLGIYFKKYGRIAHVGLIVRQQGDFIISIEGNTNLAGSREGEGVYLKMRHIKTIYRMANWVSEGRKPE